MEQKKSHRLKEWLKNNGLSALAFSQKSKINQEIIYKTLQGRKPQIRNAKRISRYTNHEVSLEDLGH